MADFSHLDRLLESFVENGLPGCGCAIARDGKIIYESYHGWADVERRRKTDENTVYRLYSMTKVVICTAAMMLFERGKFLLNDPLSDYFPDFRDAQVLRTRSTGEQYLAPPAVPYRVKHAFSMGVGMPYAGDSCPTALAMQEVKKRLTEKYGKYDLLTEIPEMIRLPHTCDPGEHFVYGYGHELVAGLIQLCSGMKVSEFLQKEIIDPLGMASTGYRCFGDIRERMVDMAFRDPDGSLHAGKGFLDEFHEPDAIFELGGAGLFSTVRDYLKFASMLACGGVADGRQYIGRKTIDLMRQNQLNETARKDLGDTYLGGYGYGLGVRTLMSPAEGGCSASVGEFGWTGAAGTYTSIDPQERLAVVYMHQQMPNMEEYYHLRVRAAVYGALK